MGYYFAPLLTIDNSAACQAIERHVFSALGPEFHDISNKKHGLVWGVMVFFFFICGFVLTGFRVWYWSTIRKTYTAAKYLEARLLKTCH